MSNKKRTHACMQSRLFCLTFCDPMDGSLPGSSVHAILQEILEWVPMPFSRGSSQPRDHTLQEFCLPSEPPGKPKNTGVGRLSLLHRNS